MAVTTINTISKAWIENFENYITQQLERDIEDISKENEQVFADANREQLLEGKDGQGEYLPTYHDDPFGYFNGNRFAAEKYAEYKATKSPNPSKPYNVMDGYIDGTYHSTIDGIVQGGSVYLISDSPIYPEFMRATNGLAHMINNEHATIIFNNVIHPELLIKIQMDKL
jgi:hypothetical protein